MVEISIAGLDQQDIGTLLNVRTYPQYVEMVRRIQSGICPFCELDKGLNKVLHQRSGWRMWRNPFPAKNTREHLIFAPERHLTDLGSMLPEDWRAYSNMLYHFYDLTTHKGGAVVMRFGDARLNAGSVRHIHTNIIVPNGEGEVRVTLAKKPEEIEHKKMILAVFEKMRAASCRSGITEAFQLASQLSEEEFLLVADRLQ